MSLRLGFVGLGMMGFPMLENLASATAYTIRAYDQSSAVRERLSAHPAWGRHLSAADNLAALADCDVVITMLPNSKVTNAVLDGDASGPGLASILQPGATVIDMGSSNPADTMAQAKKLEHAGLTLIDAPVSGAVVKARAGTLAIMVGGDEQNVEKMRPILSHLGSTLIHTGSTGSAHAMKALNNYVYAAGLLAASEALLIAGKMKLDLNVFTDVLNASSGRNVATETKLKQFIVPRSFSAGFALNLMAKDLATANSLQALTGVHTTQLSLCSQMWAEAVTRLPAGVDNTEIYRFLETQQDLTTS